MRQLMFGLLISAATLTTVCKDPKDPSKFAEPSPLTTLSMTVEAQQVLKSPLDRVLLGRFEIRLPKTGEQSVQSATTGGACLLTQFTGIDKICTASSQCNYSGPEPLPTGGNKEWLGYCLRDQDSLPGDLATNHCWVRPDPGYCLKNVPFGTHLTPFVNTTVVYQEAQKYSPKPVKWMVYSCLNGPYDETDPTSKGCAGGPYPYMHDQGPIATVP